MSTMKSLITPIILLLILLFIYTVFPLTTPTFAQVAPRYYALANRPWMGSYWGLPEGTIGSVDLSAVGSHNYVFVTSDKPFDPAVITQAIGDGTRLDTYIPTQVEKDAWASLLGVPFNGTTLLDGLWNILTVDADPDGTTRAKPIMPTNKGVLELHLGGHSLIRSEKLPADPTTHPAWGNIQKVLQNSYQEIQKENPMLARKWMGAQRQKYELTPERTRDLMIPRGFSRVLPLPPTTTIQDDFNRADGTLNGMEATVGGVGQGWTWDANATIQTNQIYTNGGSYARADTVLSSDDHYAQATVNNISYSYRGPAVRFDNATTTYYMARPYSTSRGIWMAKMINGIMTDLGFTVGTTVNGALVYIEADGSTITATHDTYEKVVTDTSITGNLYAGFGYVNNAGSGAYYDNFEAGDLVSEEASSARVLRLFEGQKIKIEEGGKIYIQ